jgi:hypothetical protein
MLVAHIVPPQWVNTASFRMSPYYMGLAHWVPEYDNYAQGLMRHQGYLLLDNGAFEGQQSSNPVLKLSVLRINADEVVLPDEPGDGAATIRKSWSAYRNFFRNCRVMFVPQGNTPTEWKRCLDSWLGKWKSLDKPGYISIGVSSLRTSKGQPKPGSKTETLKHVIASGYPVHILGMADIGYFATELLPIALEGNVRGIDTSTAFALGARGTLLTPRAEKVRLGDPKQYKALSLLRRRLIILNQSILTYWAATGDANNGLPEEVVRETIRGWEKYYARGFLPIKNALESAGVPKGKYEVFFDDDLEGRQRRYIRIAELDGKEIDVRDYT